MFKFNLYHGQSNNLLLLGNVAFSCFSVQNKNALSFLNDHGPDTNNYVKKDCHNVLYDGYEYLGPVRRVFRENIRS